MEFEISDAIASLHSSTEIDHLIARRAGLGDGLVLALAVHA